MFNYCLILAAGEGIRLLPLTELVPKALVEVNGKPIIYHSINQVRSIIENLAITVGHIGHDIASYVLQEGATMILKTHKRGNAFWLFNSLLKSLDEPILVMPCDNIVKIDLQWIQEEYIRLSSPPCLVVPIIAVNGINGDYITGENHIVKTLSRINNDEQEIYCSGIQVINPMAINKICSPKEDFYEVWSTLILKKKLYYSNVYPYPWFSINTPQQLNEYKNKSETMSLISES